MKLLYKLQLEVVVIIKTGLHIGGSKLDLNIGGVDSPVIKDQNGRPYIPGSSLKCKMRNLLAKRRGYLEIVQESVEMKQLFGLDAQKRNIFNRTLYTRLLPPEWYPELTIDKEDRFEGPEFEHAEMDYPFTEIKFENVIDRASGRANPRQVERVPRGARFSGIIILDLYEGDQPGTYSDLLYEGFELLANDYLGGNGSRGSGRVSFKFKGWKIKIDCTPGNSLENAVDALRSNTKWSGEL